LSEVELGDLSRPVRFPLRRRLRFALGAAVDGALPLKQPFKRNVRIWGFKARFRGAWLAQGLQVMKSLLSHAASDKELRSYVIQSQTIMSFSRETYRPIRHRSRDWLLRTFQPEGLQCLEELKKHNSGAIIPGVHVGPYKWVGCLLRGLGFPVRFTQRREIPEEMYFFMQKDGLLPELLPYPESETSGLHLKALYDMVRRGTWIQHVADYPTVGGLRGRYLGVDGQWPRALWAVARLSCVPLVPILILASRGWTFRIVVGDPIYVATDGPAETAMEDALQKYFDFVNPRVFEAPWNINLGYAEAMLQKFAP
jgi:lauroyl/myristoyl acyltransferase